MDIEMLKNLDKMAVKISEEFCSRKRMYCLNCPVNKTWCDIEMYSHVLSKYTDEEISESEFLLDTFDNLIDAMAKTLLVYGGKELNEQKDTGKTEHIG